MTARRNRSRPGHVVLEDRLVLLGWLHSQLGYGSTNEMLCDARESGEGFDSRWRSHICSRLISRDMSDELREALKKYDRNIYNHLGFVNAGRTEPITLKYFQYLAVLYAEIFLDNYFNRRGKLLSSLNAWINQLNGKIPPDMHKHDPFTEEDLGKLAFWMATGSGKTIIMHINYLQFKHYNTEQLDNVLLITPNEGLSEQHIRELNRSNIGAGRFIGHTDNEISVIEITKFGKGSAVQADDFEGNNLILVDEGHKGYGGESWLDIRDSLGKTGFTFEYSATFGQALGAAKDDNLKNEYGRAIVFDYSYRHFYHDGYGKDFDIINMDKDGDMTDTLLLANMLSFYEQRLIFDEHAADLQPYNLERPLWIFAGSSVKAVRGKGGSDVLTVIRFLHKLLADRKWAETTIRNILGGKSGLKNNRGNDIFGDRLWYLRGRASVYDDMLKRVLHTESGGGLHLHRMGGSKGEIGMKAAVSNDYFGVIYIGDVPSFEKLVERDGAGIIREHDMVSGSLVDEINDKDTTVELLVGAKKFMEGWNSWRVSAMGLLNIGKNEGSQIVQLFGRGVRLRGKEMSLKRSSSPDYVRRLETLNIFALQAKYMEQFRTYLEREGAPVHGMVDIQLPIRPDHVLLEHGLVVPSVPESVAFTDDVAVLGTDKSVNVEVDMLPKITMMVSGDTGIVETAAAKQAGRKIPDLRWVDMHDIYIKLLELKSASGWHNMIVQPPAPEEILRNGRYGIVADDSVFCPSDEMQEAAAMVVLIYADKFYKKRLKRWESEHMECRRLDAHNANFQNYTIKIPGDDESLVTKIRDLVAECDQIYRKESDTLPNSHFDRHLYLPLLREPMDGIQISPPGLNEGEARFVEDLKKYCVDLDGMELFLLRNQSRQGIGFYGDGGIYPDFILWIKSGGGQRVVFVEPHGMLHEDAPDKSEKVQLCRMMRELTRRIKRQPDMVDVTLDSYVVSGTPLDDLAKRYVGEWSRLKFAQFHILFQDDDDYISEIIHGTTDFLPYGRAD